MENNKTGKNPVKISQFIAGKYPAIISTSGEYMFIYHEKHIFLKNEIGLVKLSHSKGTKILYALSGSGEEFVYCPAWYSVFPVGDRGEYHSEWTVETDRKDSLGVCPSSQSEFYWNTAAEYSIPEPEIKRETVYRLD